MESLYLLVPLGVVIVVAAAFVFVRAACAGQFDNLDDAGGQLPDED